MPSSVPMVPPAVAFVEAYPHLRGGAQRAVEGLALGLAAAGRRVVVVTPADGIFPARLREVGVDVEVVDAPAGLLRYGRSGAVPAVAAAPVWWARLARRLRQLDVDVVHAGDHRGLVLAGPAARLARRPLVWHLHATEPGTALDRLAVPLAAALVVPSRRALEVHPRLARIPVVVEAPYPRWPRPDGTEVRAHPASAPPRIATLARLHPSKGLDVLLVALSLVRRSVAGAEVVVAGGAQPEAGDVLTDLRATAVRLGLDGAFRLLGHVDDPADVLAGAAVYAQPSRPGGELLPLSVIEAAGCGLPVVASAVGSMAELVADGTTGRLVAPDDPEALAAALVELLVDRSVAAAMGSAGAERIATRHDPADFVARIADLHDRVARHR